MNRASGVGNSGSGASDMEASEFDAGGRRRVEKSGRGASAGVGAGGQIPDPSLWLAAPARRLRMLWVRSLGQNGDRLLWRACLIRWVGTTPYMEAGTWR